MHHAVVWQHRSNSNIKIVHNSIDHFLWNTSDFCSDDALSCFWIVFIFLECHISMGFFNIELLEKSIPLDNSCAKKMRQKPYGSLDISA